MQRSFSVAALVAANFLALGCSFDVASPNKATNGDYLINAQLTEANRINVATPPSELANTPFSFRISNSRKLASTSKHLAEYGPEGESPSQFDPREIYVQFEEGVTDADVARALKFAKAKVVRREIIPAAPDGSVDAVVTNNYFIELNNADIKLDKLKRLSEKFGLRGNFTFSNENAAKYVQQVFDIQDLKQELKVKSAAINYMVRNAGPNNEGSGKVTPTSPEFWFHGEYNPGISTGNRVNGATYSSWDHSVGYGVKVAVVDENFLNPGESLGSRLGGSYGVYNWTYNTVPPASNNIATGAGHGRAMASLIFSAVNDGYGTAGVAPYAFPILIHTSNDQNSRAAGINVARSWGAQVISMSWGLYRSWWEIPTQYPFYTPIVLANNENRVLVGATGNLGGGPNGNGEHFPAAYGEVMGVSAHNEVGNAASWSGGQSANLAFADVFAAGSYLPFADTNFPAIGLSYSAGGTSGATAIVAGICAQQIQQNKIGNTSAAISRLRSKANVLNGLYIVDAYKGVTQP